MHDVAPVCSPASKAGFGELTNSMRAYPPCPIGPTGNHDETMTSLGGK